MNKYNILTNKKMLSFKEIPSMAKNAGKTVLLVRHSYRTSMKANGLDPDLTPEGIEYAQSCGKLLTEMKDAFFGASPRLRTLHTARELQTGGNFQGAAPVPFAELDGFAMIPNPKDLEYAIQNNLIMDKLHEYFSTGFSSGMVPLQEFTAKLLHFLTQSEFPKKNTVLVTHDVLIMALLSELELYHFSEEDWCGYIQGGALFQAQDGSWTAYYVVPDASTRQNCPAFV